MSATDRLREIQERADRATEGPWESRLFDGWMADDGSTSYRGGVYRAGGGPLFVTNHIQAADAEFMAHARVDIPELLRAVNRRDTSLRAILALHAPQQAHGTTTCQACSIDNPESGSEWGDDYTPEEVFFVEYPCETVQILRGTLGEDHPEGLLNP